MLIDSRKIASGSRIDADVCIIGAGAAGITLARELSGRGKTVALLESGGLDFDDATQALYEGRNIGLPYFPLDVTRLRYFGGTTNHWTGWCRPLEAGDFEQRPWIKDSGWPLTRAVLDPYYARAAELVQLRRDRFDPDQLAHDMGDWDGCFEATPRLVRQFFQFSPPTRFGEVYRAELQRSDAVSVYLWANVTNIATTANAQEVTHVDVACLAGNAFTVAARKYVLATGGIENPRLLLVSNTVLPPGLGNGHDLVGRYFTEHIEIGSGLVMLSRGFAPLRMYLAGDTRPHLAAIGLAQQTQHDEQINACTLTFHRIASAGEASDGFGSLRRILRAIKEGEFPDRLAEDIGNIIGDIDLVAGYAYDKVMGHRAGDVCLIMNRCEQTPNPNSRITLSTDKDALGLNRLRMDWRLSAADKRTIRRTQEILGEDFGQAGIGRVRISLSDDDHGWPPQLDGGHHHMGTTRMHDDPRRGVVTRDCRVHGIGNLFVAGSSVFPSAGTANPTLTIVAVALRLSDHLNEQMG